MDQIDNIDKVSEIADGPCKRLLPQCRRETGLVRFPFRLSDYQLFRARVSSSPE